MINELPKVLSDKAVVKIQHDSKPNKSFLVTMEEGDLSVIKELTISDIPDESFAFTLDVPKKGCSKEEKIKYSHISHYFLSSNSDGLNKACDLIIVSKKNDNYFVILLDQKSGDPSIEKTNRQLENSKIFFIYIKSLIESIYNITVSIDKIIFKKIMATTRIRKGLVNAGMHNTKPEIDRRKRLQEIHLNEVAIRLGNQGKGSLLYEALVR